MLKCRGGLELIAADNFDLATIKITPCDSYVVITHVMFVQDFKIVALTGFDTVR